MQTFLPWPDFRRSADSLDTKRLGKQRIEAWTIYRALIQPMRGWSNHPITKMWCGYEAALLVYGLTVCDSWLSRGYRDTMRLRFEGELGNYNPDEVKYPYWFGQEDFHLAHRSNLIRKFPEYYRPQFGDIPDDLPYIWYNSKVL